MFKASLIEKHLNELSEKIEYVSQQLAELEEFKKNLEFLKTVKEEDMFSAIGKGIYVRSASKEKNLFVNVGAGVILRKTPEETAKIIESQIKSFHEAKTALMSQLEVYKHLMNQTVSGLENARKE
jgi:prefoldin alpha subunit